MNTSPNNLQEKAKPSGFRLPTVIAFIILSTSFGVISAMNPLGIVGVLFSAIAAAMLTDLSLGFRDKYTYVPAVFCTGIVSYLISAYLWRLSGVEDVERTLILAVAAFFPTVLALPVYITVKGKAGRAVSIMASAVCGVLLWLLYTALVIRSSYGTLTVDTVQSAIDTFFEPVRESLSSFSYDFAGTNVPYYSESDLDTLLAVTKSLLPSIILVSMLVIAYVVTAAARIIASCFDVDGLFPVSYRMRPFAERSDDGKPSFVLRRETIVWRIEFDVISAGVFVTAYVLTVLLGLTSMFGIAAANLTVILFPGFLYAGLRDVFSPISFGTDGAVVDGRGCFTLVLCVLALFIQPLLGGVILAISGVLSVFRENRMRKMHEKEGKNVPSNHSADTQGQNNTNNQSQSSSDVQRQNDSQGQDAADVQRQNDSQGQDAADVQRQNDSQGQVGTDVQKQNDSQGQDAADVQRQNDSQGQVGTDVQRQNDSQGQDAADVQRQNDSQGQVGTDVQRQNDNESQNDNDNNI